MIIGDTLWGILLCGLIAILCAIFIHRRHKIDKYVEEDAEECSVNSEIDYVKIYKELGYNGVLIHLLNHCIEEWDISDVPTTKNMIPKLTNCKNCGAILHSNRCEFCGTEYDWEA